MEQFLVQNVWLLLLALIWSMTWKGMALWKAARREDNVWFVVLLVVNSLGLLEIIYIYLLKKPNNKKQV